VLAQRRALPVPISGTSIAFQFSPGEYILLATEYDYFDGCNHWIYLVRRDGTAVDKISLPDTFGSFRTA